MAQRLPYLCTAYEAPCWQENCNRRRRDASCHLLPTLIWQRYLLRRNTSLGAPGVVVVGGGRFLNVSVPTVGVWCVPSATKFHVYIKGTVQFSTPAFLPNYSTELFVHISDCHSSAPITMAVFGQLSSPVHCMTTLNYLLGLIFSACLFISF